MDKLKLAAVGAGIAFGAAYITKFVAAKGYVKADASYAPFVMPAVGGALAVAAHFAKLL